jgi:flagellar basal body P-ring protein FlgI
MAIVMLAPALISPASATSRIKDLANIEGVRQNQLIGYGLVVGLNGTGDTLNNIPFTKQSLQAMLERMGVNIRGATIRTGNVAAVMVTGNLPAFGTQGTRMDVTVSALGVQEDGKKLALVKDGVSLQQLVDGLNGLGIGPRDLIGILQAIKAAGAIEADIEVM